MHSILRWVKGFLKKNTEDHLGAYASQAAFFIVLSAFPFSSELRSIFLTPCISRAYGD
uniref:hypothetical protein n=1 Tax=Coprococcus catus TaxID=116085 RepID=UPI0022E60C19|nr:hypothetical protein [Coprococcus catus]